MVDLTPKEQEVYSLYVKQSNTYKQPDVNAVYLHDNAKDPHEDAKWALCKELKRIYKHKYITEAQHKHNSKRRPDVVDLTDGTEYEIETTLKRAKRFLGMDNVIVIPVCWPDNDLATWKKLKEETR